MGLKARGIKETIQDLGRVCERTTRAMRHVLDKEGEEIAELAREYAPVWKSNLEDSIVFEKTYSGRGKKTISVSAGGTVNGVDVSEYVEYAHEHPNSGWGEGSRRKAAMLGRQVGPKFIERAVDDSMDNLMKALKEAANKL